MDDMWQLIFVYLTPRERISCESVSRYWRRMLLAGWRRQSRLDFDAIVTIDANNHQLRYDAFDAILARSAMNIREIILGGADRCIVERQQLARKHELTGALIRSIVRHCPKLQSIVIRRYLIPDIDTLSAICQLPACLRILHIESCRIDIAADESSTAARVLQLIFRKCTQLSSFRLEGRGSCYAHLIIDNDLLEQLPTSIEHLSISAGESLKVNSLHFLRRLPHLQTLSAQRSYISNEDLRTAADYCPHLNAIDISYSRVIDNFDYLSLIPKLRFLCVDGNRDYFTDAALIRILKSCCDHMEWLSVEACAQLSEYSLREIGRCHRLRHLSLWGLGRVNDDVLLSIGDGCRYIEYFDMKYCRKVTRVGLRALLKLNQLRHLFVNGIDDFDEQFAIELAKVSPYLCRVDANGSRFDVAVTFPADVPTIAIARLDD